MVSLEVMMNQCCHRKYEFHIWTRVDVYLEEGWFCIIDDNIEVIFIMYNSL